MGLPGQLNANDVNDSYTVDNHVEWEVESILGSRIHYQKLQYKVSWKGWDPDDTWYDAESFKNSPTMLRLYYKDHPDRPGPPARLDNWQDTFDREIDDPPHEMGNAAVGGRVMRMRTRMITLYLRFST